MSGLRLVFGERLDGTAWPPAPKERLLGFAAVGPAGLLALIETFTGLAGPSVPAARRIAGMRRRLSALQERSYFWSESFSVDSWAVAREILAWRDELVEAGWHRAAIEHAPARLADLAELEAMEPRMLPGAVDRLGLVLNALKEGAPLPFDQITVIDAQGVLSARSKRLLEALVGAGVAVSYQPEGTGLGSSGTDLSKVQTWLTTGQAEPLVGDGSFAVLRGGSDIALAEAVADWLAVSPDAAETVAVLDAPTGLLDGALERRGLPRFGHLPASPLRGGIQLLSLAFATCWRPFDPTALLDLLSLPQSPVPGAVGRAIAAALTEAPGRGGPRWKEAIELGLSRRRERFESQGLSNGELEKRVRQDQARWLPWLEGDVFEVEEGIPANAARGICGRVAAWSARVAQGEPGPITAVGGFATTLSQVIAEAGLDPIPRTQLERMIDAVIADGVDADHVQAEAGEWSHVFHPGQIWGDAGTVLWWGIGANPISRRSQVWTDAELVALREAGCQPNDRAVSLSNESAAWRRAISNARDRLILATPSATTAEEDSHPLLHELAPLLARAPGGVFFDAETLFETDAAAFAGGQIVRAAAPTQSLPQPREHWSAPPGVVKPRSVDAATSIELLLGCPFAWTVQYPGRLNPSRRSEVPKGERLIGLLAHALIAELLQPGQPPEPAQARQQAEARLPTLIDEMASPLRLPGASAEYARALSRLPIAVETLVHELARLSLTIVKGEAKRDALDALMPGVSLSGRLDLLVSAPSGEPAVVDFKWSRTDRYRREEIAAGHSIQLATYGRMLGTDGAPAPGAYFMLSQARLLPVGDNLFGQSGGGPGSPHLSDVWGRTRESWKERMHQLSQGSIRAMSENVVSNEDPAGSAAETALALQPEPPCRFCDKAILCGHARIE